MKQIDKTEAYNEAMRNVRIYCNGTKGQITLQTNLRFHYQMTFESEITNNRDKLKDATEHLAYNTILSLLKQCGISHRDISLLEIAKELAVENDTEGYICGLECG